MKKLITSSAFILLSLTSIMAQPVLYSDSLQTGRSFNLYQLANVNMANITPGGAGVTWDISGTTATAVGTVDFEPMSATPYAAQYPAANFAVKFTILGSTNYSLFNLSNTVFEEVANNVGSANPVSFIDYRTALFFPFGFNSVNTDTYQKSGQNPKMVTNNCDAYGTVITNTSTINNVVRNAITDDGSSSAIWYSSSPLIPIFQVNNGGTVILWELTSSTGVVEYSNSLFDMYPNPATTELKIINKGLITKIEILDISGQLQFATTQSTVDISKLKAGIYFVKAYSENGTISQKFVKE